MTSYNDIYRKRLGMVPPGMDMGMAPGAGGSQPLMAEDRGGGNTRPSYLEGMADINMGMPRPQEVVGDPRRELLNKQIGSLSPQPAPGLQPKASVGTPVAKTIQGNPTGGSNVDPGMMQAAQGQVQAAQPGQPEQDIGGYGTAAIGLGDLGALLERNLANPSAWDSSTVQGIRDNLAVQREQSRREAAGRVNADAARRGAFYSTIPALGQQRVERDLYSQEAQTDAQLAMYAANARDQGVNSAVNNAMNFINQGQNNQLQQLLGLGQLGQMAGTVGNQGAPDMNQAMYNLMAMGGGQAGGFDPALFGLVGQLFGGRTPAAQPNG